MGWWNFCCCDSSSSVSSASSASSDSSGSSGSSGGSGGSGGSGSSGGSSSSSSPSSSSSSSSSSPSSSSSSLIPCETCEGGIPSTLTATVSGFDVGVGDPCDCVDSYEIELLFNGTDRWVGSKDVPCAIDIELACDSGTQFRLWIRVNDGGLDPTCANNNVDTFPPAGGTAIEPTSCSPLSVTFDNIGTSQLTIVVTE